MTAGEFIVVLGGARSGKSTWAEILATEYERPVTYVATANAYDEEMEHRIVRHQRRRPQTWETVEAPLHTADAVAQATGDVILLDCLTIFASNWLLHYETTYAGDALIERVLGKVDALLEALVTCRQPAILVTNEVGQGVVPAYALGRVFRDIAGTANQRAAAAAHRVYWTVAGIPVDVKRLRADQ